MATISMTNLNDSPTEPGPLTAAELRPWQPVGAFDDDDRAEDLAQTEYEREDPLGCFVGMRSGLLLMAAAALCVAAVLALLP